MFDRLDSIKEATNKLQEWLRRHESVIAFYFFLCFLACLTLYYLFALFTRGFDIHEQVFPSFLNNFGFLGLLSLPPLSYLGYWARKSPRLRFTLILMISVILINFLFAWCNTYPSSSFQLCYRRCEKYFPSIFSLLFSGFYGIISINSCLEGLKMKKKNHYDDKFSSFSFTAVFVSIAVVLYIFLLENLEKIDQMVQLNPLLLSFIFLAISISFLYVMMGYHTQNRDGTYSSLFLVFSVAFCFSIGTMLSIFVLQYERIAGTLITHWVFLCIWTMFLDSMPTFISIKETGLPEIIGGITNRIGNLSSSRCEDLPTEYKYQLYGD